MDLEGSCHDQIVALSRNLFGGSENSRMSSFTISILQGISALLLQSNHWSASSIHVLSDYGFLEELDQGMEDKKFFIITSSISISYGYQQVWGNG
jgi:hypothetical protein